MTTKLKELVIDRVDLVDQGANTKADILLYKRKEQENTMSFEEILAKLKPEHAEVITAEIAKYQEAKVEEKPVTEEEVIKSLDPSVQAIFKAMQAKQEEAEKVVKALKEKQDHDEAVMKAKELKALPVEEDQLITVAKSVSSDVFEILKKAAAAVEAGAIFEEVGKNTGEASTDVWSKVEKKAEEIAARDSISNEKAISKVFVENPDLYKEYLEEGGVR